MSYVDDEDRAKKADAVHPFPWTCNVMGPDRAHVTDNDDGIVIAYVVPVVGSLIVQEANAAAARHGILT